MAIIGEDLEFYVQNQIKARQTLHGSGVGHTGTLRTDKQINLLNSNTSWIKLASGVSISGSNRLSEIGIPDADIPKLKGMGLAKNNILFSGISKISSQTVEGNFYTQLEQREGFLPRNDNSSYTYGSFGFSPMPGIHSADIKTLTRGSLKKATVKLTANNKQQFDIIDLLYMRLGYTVLLEWGNSIYTITGGDKEILRNTLIEDMFFNTESNGSYLEMLVPIANKRKEYSGNYDALLGKVSNFNWSFNTDGSYDIELTIISLGDVIESLKSNLSVDENTNKFLTAITPSTNQNSSDEETSGDEETLIDEENSSADIITAMLAIYKFINHDNPSEKRISIQTSEKDSNTGFNKRYPIGEFLNTKRKKDPSGAISAGTYIIQFEATITGKYKEQFNVLTSEFSKQSIKITEDENFSTTILSPQITLTEIEYTSERRKKEYDDFYQKIKEKISSNPRSFIKDEPIVFDYGYTTFF